MAQIQVSNLTFSYDGSPDTVLENVSFNIDTDLYATWREIETVKIGTAAELTAFADRVNAGEKTLCAELTADIDLTDILFSGIGFTSGDAFNGTFDGKGFSVKTDDNTPVIFGYTGENSVIKNSQSSIFS